MFNHVSGGGGGWGLVAAPPTFRCLMCQFVISASIAVRSINLPFVYTPCVYREMVVGVGAGLGLQQPRLPRWEGSPQN